MGSDVALFISGRMSGPEIIQMAPQIIIADNKGRELCIKFFKNVLQSFQNNRNTSSLSYQ